MSRKEAQVKAGVQAYLDTRTDLFFWRENTVAGFSPSGNYIRSNMRGAADFIGVQARVTGLGMEYGLFVAIEVKREKGGKQTEEQILFQKNVEAHGGRYVLARSVDEVAQALGPVFVNVKKARKMRVVPR